VLGPALAKGDERKGLHERQRRRDALRTFTRFGQDKIGVVGTNSAPDKARHMIQREARRFAAFVGRNTRVRRDISPLLDRSAAPAAAASAGALIRAVRSTLFVLNP